MATFGKNTVGTSSAGIYAVGDKFATRFQGPTTENGEITSIVAYLAGNNWGANPSVAFVYSDNSGAPSNLLGVSNPTQTSSPGWFTFNFPTPIQILANKFYWLGVMRTGTIIGECTLPQYTNEATCVAGGGEWNPNSNFISVFWDAGASNQTAVNINSNPTTPDATFGVPAYLSQANSVYAVYTPSAPTQFRVTFTAYPEIGVTVTTDVGSVVTPNYLDMPAGNHTITTEGQVSR